MTANDHNPLVVVGSGLAGYTLIRQFRAYDRTRPVTLVTADGGEVYSKPLLSNALAKGHTPEAMVQKSAQAKAAELDITLVPRCWVAGIDAKARVLRTTEGEIAYSDLVLATGARQRLIIPADADTAWVDTVNSLDDYRRWYAKLEAGVNKVLLIGAGLIGCEFADDLMYRGFDVTLVDPAPWPLARLLPEALGSALSEALRETGADLRLGRYLTHLEPRAARPHGTGFSATLDDGAEIEPDLVLSAVGLVPEIDLAASAGLDIEQGVRVDQHLRSSDPHIYAIGDCAQTRAGVLPYILPLMAQAKVLAQVLAGQEVTLTLKAMPVVVKTTSLPLVVCPPRADARGAWRIAGQGRDLSAVFHATGGEPLGFALAGAAAAQRTALSKTMPPLLA
jgi:rubredoxin-NAD+ reductase